MLEKINFCGWAVLNVQLPHQIWEWKMIMKVCSVVRASESDVNVQVLVAELRIYKDNNLEEMGVL